MSVTALITTNVFAQNSPSMVRDSLLANGTIRSTVQFFYIKPIAEQYQPLVSVEGSGFSAPEGDLVRKRGLGIRFGYRWGAFEIETGLSTIQPAAGYRYMLNGRGYSTRVRSTDYQQIPVIIRYRFWQPTKRLSLRIGAGAAYNVDRNKLSLASEDHFEEGTLDANGNKVILAKFTGRYDKVKSFFSGEVSLSAHYQFATRLSVSVEGKRLFGSMGEVRFTSIRETFNPPAIQRVDARGGASSYNINVGIAYQFGFRYRYDLE